jgi:hypothetical protein
LAGVGEARGRAADGPVVLRIGTAPRECVSDLGNQLCVEAGIQTVSAHRTAGGSSAVVAVENKFERAESWRSELISVDLRPEGRPPRSGDTAGLASPKASALASSYGLARAKPTVADANAPLLGARGGSSVLGYDASDTGAVVALERRRILVPPVGGLRVRRTHDHDQGAHAAAEHRRQERADAEERGKLRARQHRRR